MIRRYRNIRGITLVALVVTIIVLLILAAVSINLVLGDNGIITRAKQSRENTKYEKIKEEVDLAITEAKLQKDTLNLGDMTFVEYLEELLKKKDSNATVKDYPSGILDIFYKENNFEMDVGSDTLNELITIGSEVIDIKSVDEFSCYVLYKDGRVKEADYRINTIDDLNKLKADNYLSSPHVLYSKQFKELDYSFYNGMYLLSNDNKVYEFKGNTLEESSMFNGINGIHGISLKDSTLVFLDENNNVYAQGSNYYKQFGLGDLQGNSYDAVVNLSENSSVLTGKTIVKAKGGDRVGVLDSEGNLFVAGDNWGGGLGLGNIDKQSTFVEINSKVDNKKIVDFELESYAGMVITEDGKLYTTGRDDSGFGREIYTFGCLSDNCELLKDKKIIKVAVDDVATCVDSDGKLYVWGNDKYGRTPMCFSDSEYAGDLSGKKIVDVNVSKYRVIAVDVDGIAYDFGGLNENSLGRGDSYYAKSLNNREGSSLKGRKVSKLISMNHEDAMILIDDRGQIHFTGDDDFSDYYTSLTDRFTSIYNVICLSEFKEGIYSKRVATVDGIQLDKNGHIIDSDFKIKNDIFEFDFNKSYKKVVSNVSWGSGSIKGLDKDGVLHNAYRNENNEYVSEELTDIIQFNNRIALKKDKSLYSTTKEGAYTLVDSSIYENKIIKQLIGNRILTEDNNIGQLNFNNNLLDSVTYIQIDDNCKIEEVIGATDDRYIVRTDDDRYVVIENDIYTDVLDILRDAGYDEDIQIRSLKTDGTIVWIKLSDDSEYLYNFGYPSEPC